MGWLGSMREKNTHWQSVSIVLVALASIILLGLFAHQPAISFPVVIVGSYLLGVLAHQKRRNQLSIELTLEYIAISVAVWFVLSSLL